MCDDKYVGDYDVYRYYAWATPTVAAFQRETVVELRLETDGSKVQVGGTFNDWRLVDAQRLDGRTWSAKVHAVRGTHRYKWVVDGVWTVDSKEEACTDKCGITNNVLYV